MNRRNFVKASLSSLPLGVFGSGVLHARAPAPAPAPPAQAQSFHARRQQVATSYGRISYVEQGSGEAALFLHGWPLNGFHWRDVMDRLATQRRCLAPDFMGLGYTEVPADADLSPAHQAQMIVSFLDTLGVQKVDIVANDSGITVAQLIAVRHPARVRSLLLTNGDVHTNSPPEALKPAIEAARQGLLVDMIEKHFTQPGFAHSPQGLGGICYTNPENLTAQAMDVYFRPLLASPTRRRQFQQYGVAFEPNPLPAIEGQLATLQIPARMVWGDADIHFGVEWARWLDAKLPQSRGVRIVPGGKLFFTEEQPDLIAEEARKLWAAL